MTEPLLQALAPNLWVLPRPLRFLGLFPIGTRMTVIRLSNGALWLCSPVEIDDGLATELDALGRVEHVVGPNRWHHLYLSGALERYPDAHLHLAPGLAEKRHDLADGHTLNDQSPDAWASEIDQLVLRGVPTFNEVAFLHKASRTLILTDHLFHLEESCPAVARALGVTMGVRREPGLPLDARLLFIRDKAALRGSIETLLRWDFDRVVLTHGRIVETGGHEAMRRAYRFLLE